MGKKQKLFYLSEENICRLKELQKELNMSSESQVINYLIGKAFDNSEEKIAQAVRKELEKNYLPKERIRWGVQTAEQNTILLLDAVNTLMHKEQLQTCIDVEFAPSPVIEQSRERLKEKISYFKQKSDDRKSKGKG